MAGHIYAVILIASTAATDAVGGNRAGGGGEIATIIHQYAEIVIGAGVITLAVNDDITGAGADERGIDINT